MGQILETGQRAKIKFFKQQIISIELKNHNFIIFVKTLKNFNGSVYLLHNHA